MSQIEALGIIVHELNVIIETPALTQEERNARLEQIAAALDAAMTLEG